MTSNAAAEKKNMRKYESYKLAFDMIDEGIVGNCPLQSIAVEESIMSDRLWSALNATKEKGRKHETLGKALTAWRELKAKGQPTPFDAEAEAMYEGLQRWWDKRSRLIHGIVKSFRGKGPQTTAAKFRQSAMNAAKLGKELARNVCNWSSKQISKSRKAATNRCED